MPDSSMTATTGASVPTVARPTASRSSASTCIVSTQPRPNSVAKSPNAAEVFSRSLLMVVVIRPPIAVVRLSSITR